MDPVNWLERLRDGDPAAMEPLLSEYGPMMDYIVRGILSDVHAREDCLAEVRAKLWERRLLYDPGRASPAAWITALCRNAAYDRLRARRRQEARTRSLEEDHPDPLPGPEEALLRQEGANELSRALSSLSRRDYLLFYRKYCYLQSTAQIAAELGVTERAVEGRLYRLRKKLQHLLGGEL